MSWVRRWQRALRPAELRRELEEEQRFHMQARREELIASGDDPRAAGRKARVAFGEPTKWQELSQEAKTSRWLSGALADTRYAFRMMRRRPGFAAAAILSLALGLGASTAVFSVVAGALLRPEPFPHPRQLQYVWSLVPPQFQTGSKYSPWLRHDFWLLRADLTAPGHSFAALGAMAPATYNLTGVGQPLRLQAVQATAGVFAALKAKPELGRVYTAAEDQPGRGQFVLLSDAVWRTVFHADRGVIGRGVALNAMPYTVLGVMPPGFNFPDTAALPSIFAFPHATQIWVPAALSQAPTVPYENNVFAVVGRLRAGVTVAEAQAEATRFADHLTSTRHLVAGLGYRFELEEVAHLDGDGLRRPLLLLLLAVALVLLVACSNVAGLLLSRSLARQPEFALRAALGAGRRHMAQQLLVEALWLAVWGGALGAMLALAALRTLRVVMASALPQLAPVSLDWRVFGFGLAAMLLSGLLCALAPIAALGRSDRQAHALNFGKGAAASGGSPRLRGLLVAGQMALALVLVVASGLLTRSLAHLLAAGGGFDPQAAVTAQLSLPANRYPTQTAAATFYQSVRRNLDRIPGVVAAGVALVAPLNGASESDPLLVAGRPISRTNPPPMADYSMVSAGYFQAAGIRVLQGRGIVESDVAGSLPICVVNQALAQNVFPGGNALGRHIRVPTDKLPQLIVGVIENPKHERLDEASEPEMFVPITQNPFPPMDDMALVVRVHLNSAGQLPADLRQQVAAAVHAVDPDVPLAHWQALQQLVARAVAPARFALTLLTTFALLTLLLAAVGLYGVVALIAGQRQRELGVRLALGASRGSLFGLVLRQGALLAAAGIAVGWFLALVGARVLRSYLFGVGAFDPLTLTLAPLLLAAVALAACLLPARRAARLDVLAALRQD